MIQKENIEMKLMETLGRTEKVINIPLNPKIGPKAGYQFAARAEKVEGKLVEQGYEPTQIRTGLGNLIRDGLVVTYGHGSILFIAATPDAIARYKINYTL